MTDLLLKKSYQHPCKYHKNKYKIILFNGYWVNGLMGYWVIGLLGYWVIGLLGYWVIGEEDFPVGGKYVVHGSGLTAYIALCGQPAHKGLYALD